jgi:hypothetical protein
MMALPETGWLGPEVAKWVFWAGLFIALACAAGWWRGQKSSVGSTWLAMWRFEKEDVWPFRKTISLHDAAQLAYEATQNLWTARLAENPDLSPQGILHAYATEILGNFDIPVYGVRSPSNLLRSIPRDDLYDYLFSDDARKLEDPSGKEPPHENVTILCRDFRQRLKQIKARKGLDFV